MCLTTILPRRMAPGRIRTISHMLFRRRYGYGLAAGLATGLAFGAGVAVASSLWGWGRPNWGGGNVTINANQFNRINANRTVDLREHLAAQRGAPPGRRLSRRGDQPALRPGDDRRRRAPGLSRVCEGRGGAAGRPRRAGVAEAGPEVGSCGRGRRGGLREAEPEVGQEPQQPAPRRKTVWRRTALQRKTVWRRRTPVGKASRRALEARQAAPRLWHNIPTSPRRAAAAPHSARPSIPATAPRPGPMPSAARQAASRFAGRARGGGFQRAGGGGGFHGGGGGGAQRRQGSRWRRRRRMAVADD